MSWHWKLHIAAGVLILLLLLAGMYLIGANRALQDALVTSYEKQGDLKAVVTGVMVEGFNLADELRRTALDNLNYKDKLDKQLSLDPEHHALVRAKEKQKKKRRKKKRRKAKTAVGGP